MPKVEYKYDHGVELIIKSELALTEAVAIQFPIEYKNNISVKNLVIDDDGVYHYTPNGVPMKEIGSVVGMGRSLGEAVKMATEIAKTIKGFDLKINTDCIEDAQKQIAEMAKIGIRYL